jgi:hypothetical protein
MIELMIRHLCLLALISPVLLEITYNEDCEAVLRYLMNGDLETVQQRWPSITDM